MDWRNNETMIRVEEGEERRRAAVLQDTMAWRKMENVHTVSLCRSFSSMASTLIGNTVLPRS